MRSTRQERLTDLAAEVHGLMHSVVMTDVDERTLEETTAALRLLADRIRPDVSPLEYRDNYQTSGRKTANPFDSQRNPMTGPMKLLEWADGRCVMEAVMGPVHEGPPGRVHGGVVSGLLDNASGRATASLGLFAMSVQLDVRFLGATPYAEPLRISAEVVEQVRRRLTVDATVQTESGEVTARSRALFIRIADEAVPGTPSREELVPLK